MAFRDDFQRHGRALEHPLVTEFSSRRVSEFLRAVLITISPQRRRLAVSVMRSAWSSHRHVNGVGDAEAVEDAHVRRQGLVRLLAVIIAKVASC